MTLIGPWTNLTICSCFTRKLQQLEDGLSGRSFITQHAFVRAHSPPYPVDRGPWTVTPRTRTPWTVTPWTVTPRTRTPWTGTPWTGTPWTVTLWDERLLVPLPWLSLVSGSRRDSFHRRTSQTLPQAGGLEREGEVKQSNRNPVFMHSGDGGVGPIRGGAQFKHQVIDRGARFHIEYAALCVCVPCSPISVELSTRFPACTC